MKRRYVYSFITIGLISTIFISCAKKSEPKENKSQPNNALITENLSKAEELSKQHNDLSKLREAVKLLAQIRNSDNRNYEVEWKFARCNYFLGKLISDEKEGEKIFKDGEAAGKIASRLEPNKPDGFYWYGANLGEQAKRSPLTKGLTSVDNIRSAMNRVIEIEPAYQGASAFDVLAQIELSTGLVGGKPEKAVEYLEKAIVLEKENTYIRLHLAQAYLAVNRDAEAKKQLDYIMQMKPNPDYLPEYEESLKEAKRLLATKFK
jgi:tetratricopeptide (TPR) repeat protein